MLEALGLILSAMQDTAVSSSVPTTLFDRSDVGNDGFMTNTIDAHQLRRRIENLDRPSINDLTDRLPSSSDLRQLPGASRLSDLHIPDVHLPDVRLPDVRLPSLHLPYVDVPDLSAVTDSLSDAADSIVDAATVAGRESSRLAVRAGRTGAAWGATGVRAASRTARSTARSARNNPRVTIGVVMAIIGVIAAVSIVRKRRQSSNERDQHLAAVA